MQILHCWFLLILAPLAAGLLAFLNFLDFFFLLGKKQSASFSSFSAVRCWMMSLLQIKSNHCWFVLLQIKSYCVIFLCFPADLIRIVPELRFLSIKWIIRGAGCGGWDCWFWDFGQLLWCLARLKMPNWSRRKSAGPNAEETRDSLASRGNSTVNCLNSARPFKVH